MKPSFVVVGAIVGAVTFFTLFVRQHEFSSPVEILFPLGGAIALFFMSRSNMEKIWGTSNDSQTIKVERFMKCQIGETTFLVGDKVMNVHKGYGVLKEIIRKPNSDIRFMVAFSDSEIPSEMLPEYLSKS